MDEKKKKAHIEQNFDNSDANENFNEDYNEVIDENQISSSNLQKEQETF